MTVKISFLVLLLSLSINTSAGDRLEGSSGSMEKSANPFSKLLGKNTENEEIDTTDKRQREEITVETKHDAERDASQIKDGERHEGIKNDSASFSPEQENKSVDNLPEIDIISDVNAEFEDTINELEAAAKSTIESTYKRPTQSLIDDRDALQTANKSKPVHATNEIVTIQAASKGCVKEKVYTLDVDNAAQYKRLEDFPFTYECVIQR